jgi:hypothetical protein
MHRTIMQPAVAVLALAASLTVTGCADRSLTSTRARDKGALSGLRARADERLARSAASSVLVQGVDTPVVLITIDGVRWKEIFEGTDPAFSKAPWVPAATITPNLHKLGSERGAFVGAPGRGTIAASGPNYISLPGYTEILGGRPSVACQRNDCSRTLIPTILDEARAAGAKIAAFTSWSTLELAVTATPGTFAMSCGRRGGEPIDPSPGHGDYRPDRVTADLALTHFEIEQPDVFYLGFGDPDEHAHYGNYGGYIEAIQQADAAIGRLMSILDRSERGRRTHVFVTADHGRADDFRNHGPMPEAARVWMVAAGPKFRARGNVASLTERRLADIAPTMRRVLGLTPDVSDRAGRPIDELFTDNVPGL